MDVPKYFHAFDEASLQNEVLGNLCRTAIEIVDHDSEPTIKDRDCQQRILQIRGKLQYLAPRLAPFKLFLKELKLQMPNNGRNTVLKAHYENLENRRPDRWTMPDGSVKLTVNYNEYGRLTYIQPLVTPRNVFPAFMHEELRSGARVRVSGNWSTSFLLSDLSENKEITIVKDGVSMPLLKVPAQLDEENPDNLIGVFSAEALKVLQVLQQQ